MATQQTYQAQLDSYRLECLSADDTFDKALVRHEYADRDGAELEDQGMRARVVRVPTIWRRGTYDNHQAFLAHIQRSDITHTFIHPAYGELFGKIGNTTARHEANVRTVYIDFEFIEQKINLNEAQISPLVVPPVERAFSASQSSLLDTFRDRIVATLGTEGAGIMGATLTGGIPVLSQLGGLSRAARSVIGQIDTAVATLDAAVSLVTNPVDSLISSISYANNLPGRVIGSVTRAVERVGTLFNSIVGSPNAFLGSLVNGVAQLKSESTAVANDLTVVLAQYGSLVLAYTYEADEAARDQVRAIETAPTIDSRGMLVEHDLPQILTLQDLEQSLATIRGIIQTALDIDRSNTALQTMAFELLRHVNTIKLERERLVTEVLSSEQPLHVVCHRRGLSFAYAERLLALNPDIQNPTFSSGELMVYA